MLLILAIFTILSFTAFPEAYTGITPKTLYVHRGNIAEIPCDYKPGKANDLYSVSWTRNNLATVNADSLPYLGISASSYSLFVLTNVNSFTESGTPYQCRVSVMGCSGTLACSSLQMNEPGAVVNIQIIGNILSCPLLNKQHNPLSDTYAVTFVN